MTEESRLYLREPHSRGSQLFFPAHRSDQKKTKQKKNENFISFVYLDISFYGSSQVLRCLPHDCGVPAGLEGEVEGSAGGPRGERHGHQLVIAADHVAARELVQAAGRGAAREEQLVAELAHGPHRAARHDHGPKEGESRT